MGKRNKNRNVTAPVEEKVQTRSNSPIKYILDQQKLRTRQDLLKLRLAVDVAENVTTYDRSLLHDIFRDVEKDPNLASNWESRKMKVKEKPFKIKNQSGEENEELTDLLENATWFFDFIDHALDSRMWGFSLIEFGPLEKGRFLPYKVGNKFYNPVTCIDRDNVKPELGIITNTPGLIEGISFDDPIYSDYLMFIGDFRSYGILGRLAKYILFKDNALGNWSEWAEVFGMDKRVGYTDSEGPQRTDFLRAIRDMGSNAYGVFGSRDKVEYLGTQRTDAYKVYHEYIKYIDSQSSKGVWGQDVVQNNTGQVVGEVGENISNMYGDNDAKFIKTIVNSRLFPMMENLGFSWQGHKFEWDTTEKLSLSERAKIDSIISKDLGKEHSDDYVNKTYGTEVTKKEVPEMNTPDKIQKELKAMYKNIDTGN